MYGFNSGSRAHVYDTIASSGSPRAVIRAWIKEFKISERPYQCTLLVDNDPGLLATTKSVADEYPNIVARALSENEPWGSEAEGNWRWLTARARAILAESRLGPEFTPHSLAHAAVHSLYLPTKALGGKYTLQLINAGGFITDLSHTTVDLVPFGCLA